MQPCKTGDQPYSDASPNGECSLLLCVEIDRQITIILDMADHQLWAP